jgi:NAD(P)-dependent dehydrogenase (short-subunit alcohol dehydrogenase family)
LAGWLMVAGEKRVCLFTGISGKLGTEFSQLYAREYHIAGVFLRTAPSFPTQQQRFVDPLDPGAAIAENDDAIFAINADLRQPGEVKRVVELTLARFGRIDLLVNAAVHSVWAPMLQTDRLVRSAEAQFRLNVVVPLELASIVARDFWRTRERENIRWNRNVVNISSLAGINVYQGLGQSVYAAAKAAVNHLTRHMAFEFDAIGIRVNALAPNSFPRFVTTAKVAAAIVELDRGRMIGEIWSLDGERRDRC